MEKTMAPNGFTVGIEDSVTTLTLTFETGDKPTELRFQHPSCEAHKVGLCLIAYELLAKTDPVTPNSFNGWRLIYVTRFRLRNRS